MDLLTRWNLMLKFKKALYISIIIFLLLFVLLLTAKTAIISAFIFLNIAFIDWGKKYAGTLKTILSLVLINTIIVMLLFSLPFTRERFRLLLTYNDVIYENSVNSREEIMRSGMQMAADNIFTGTGSGDVTSDLVEYYKQNNFQQGVKGRYNAHNEYLQVLLETGFAGLIFFILIFIYSIRHALQRRNFIYLTFLLLFMINIATESMLKTQSGVVFYAVFNSLLGLKYKQ
jgi:O-antigen ligase